MYLHIGNGKSIKKDKIIGIFDIDPGIGNKQDRRQAQLCPNTEESGLLQQFAP